MSKNSTQRVDNPAVCPESTLESAFQRDEQSPPALKAKNDLRPSDGLVCESTIESTNRRNFVRKAVTLTAAAGIASTLLVRDIIPVSSASSNKKVVGCCSTACGVGVLGKATGIRSTGVKGCAAGCCSIGVAGHGCWRGVTGTGDCAGVYGEGLYGVYGLSLGCARISSSGVFGFAGLAPGVAGVSNSNDGVVGSTGSGYPGYAGVKGVSALAAAIPIIAQGASCQTANLQEWQNHCAKPLSVVNPCGWFGIGTCSPKHGVCSISSSSSGVAIKGTSSGCGGSGVWGCAPPGIGVYGNGKVGVEGVSSTCAGVRGISLSTNVPGVEGLSDSPCSIPIIAKGYPCQQAPLQEWRNACCVAMMTVNKRGWLGIGTTPSAALCVEGNISAYSCSTAISGVTCSKTGTGVKGEAKAKTGANFGVVGVSCSKSGAGVLGEAGNPAAIPIIARGNAKQTGNLQQWQLGCSTPLSVVNEKGWLGIGTSAPGSTLCVKGNISAVSCSTTVFGASRKAQGVFGESYSCKGTGVSGIANCGTGGTGVYGQGSAVGVRASAWNSCSVPLVAQGAPCQCAPLQEWQVCEVSGPTAVSVVNPCGWFGLGTGKRRLQSTLCVVGCATITGTLKAGSLSNGGVSLGLKTIPNCQFCYSMKTTDFAILANPTSIDRNVILPAASNTGMLVFIKNISSNAVNVKAAGTDMIEVNGVITSAYSLSTNYASVTLIAGGAGVWYILSNAT